MTDTARDWQDLDEFLFRGAWNPELRRFRSRQAFRGMARAEGVLEPGLFRLGGDAGAKERHLIRNFRKYARRSFVGDDSVWNWMALAQQHGLPTRLLDWSYSPYVALHFATASSDAMAEDGKVLAADFGTINQRLPGPLRDLLDEEGSEVFTGELLSSVASILSDLNTVAEEEFLLFLEPPSLTDRIINQAALFSLMSRPEARLETWLTRHPDAWRGMVVPAELKWEVRDRLDQVNITERVLFPGLDGLTAWLARYYRER